MVNINVSKLLSSSGSNSKNSITFNHSKETVSLSKQSNSNNNTFNKQLSPNNFHTSSSITSKNSKKPATSGNNSVESSKSGQYKNSKRAITAKRKNIYEKLMKKNKIKLESKKKEQDDSQIIDENELKDIVNDVNFNYSTEENKSTNNPNVKITNITNIIVNVKNIGTKSFDIKSMSTKTGKDMMMRDMKSLHLITQKALTAENPKLSSVDSFDDERTSFLNFRTNTKNELYIDDNTDNKNIDSQKTPNSKLSQIINIININKNYSIKGNATPRVGKTSTYQHNYFCTEPGSINQGDSFRTAKTKSNKVIPIYRNHESNNSSSNISGRSLAVKDFINSIKNSKKTKKEKFIAIGKLKK